MSHENSQFEIPVIQLRESRTQPRVSLSREIGEAQITHTIFGRAKVRIIRKGDQARRYMILAAIAVVAVAAAAWQGWLTPQQTEPVQSADLAPAASAVAQADAPASQPENAAALVPAPSVQSAPVTPPATGIGTPAVAQKNVPQYPAGLKVAEPKLVKPVVAQPKPVTDKPKPLTVEPLPASQMAPAAINKDALNNPAAKPLPVKRPAMPVAATQSAASSPAAVAPPAVPSGKEDTVAPSPLNDTQLSAPISATGN